ncbi:MAG: ABC transporter substrate-binding protein, partial [Thermomicrobiales bacterium]
MEAALLATKVRIPPRTHHLVRRPRLVDALERDVPHHKLVLISAPAGYGKTTLLAEWAHDSRVPVAWLSLGEEDDDRERFLRYLLTAWEQVLPGLRERPAGLLLGGMSPDIDAVLSAFINAANDVADHTVFVLDDYHLIADPSIHQALNFLLDHLPPALHFVLAGRGEPPLPLARYRARQELLELGAEELGFLVDETDAFLNQQMGLDLIDDEIASLHAQLEGWIAGLQLVSLTLRRQREPANRIVVSGRHRFIADYLHDDVLAHLPDDRRQFLLQTSILDRLCGPLCDAVTEGAGSQEMLERLERENLFLVPLDDNREWFRYHRLFADVLREELTRRHSEEVAGLHRRAAAWHLAHDLPEPALAHAVAGDDLDLGVRIFDRYMNAMLNCGEFTAVQRWLDALPASWYAAYPALDLPRAGLLAFTGAVDACIRCVDDVEQRLTHAEGDDARWQMARVTAIRCAIACIQNDVPLAETFADQALRDLPAADLGFRPMIYGALGDTYRRNGRWEEAHTCYLKLLDFAHAPVFRVLSAHLFGALADLELRKGRLRDAGGYWKKALVAIEEREHWGRLPLPVIGWVFIRMGELLYEWNDLAAAWDHLSRGLERSELGGDVRALIAGYVTAARVKLTEGDVPAAADYLERARPLVEQASFPEWASRFERVQIDLWLAQDRLRAAVDWSDAMLAGDVLQQRPENESAQLALARVLIVKGDAPARERALALLARLRQAAEAEGRMGVQIEALALHALAYWQAGDRAGAMTALEQALRLAEPEGYLRLFADLGLPMARLLQEARSRHVMPDYVGTLLAACGGEDEDDDGDDPTATSAAGPPEATATQQISVIVPTPTPITAATQAATAAATTAAATATAPAGAGPTKGGRAVFLREGDASNGTYDPVLSDDNDVIWVIFSVYETLVRPNTESTGIDPGLAESWEITEDALTATFHLREGLKFSDGSDVTTDDIIFSLERARDSEGSPWTFTLAQAQEITAPDDATIVVNLSEPYVPFFAGIAMFNAGIISKSFFEANAQESDPAFGGLAITTGVSGGAGPYAITTWDVSE